MIHEAGPHLYQKSVEKSLLNVTKCAISLSSHFASRGFLKIIYHSMISSNLIFREDQFAICGATVLVLHTRGALSSLPSGFWSQVDPGSQILRKKFQTFSPLGFFLSPSCCCSGYAALLCRTCDF